MGVGDHGGSLGGGRRGRRGCVASALPDVDIAAPAVRFVRWPYKTRRWVERVDADSHGHGSTRMSFERPTGAGSRADQSTVRRANLGVVLKQIAAGEPRSRARVAAETGLTRGTVSSLVGELIELDLLRETGEDEHVGRVGRPAQTLELADRIVCHRPRGQRRLPGRLRRGPDRRDSLRASRPHRQPAIVAAARAEPPRRGWRSRRSSRSPGTCSWFAAGRRGRGARPRRGADGHACSGRRTSAGRRSPSRTRSPHGFRAPGLTVRADNEVEPCRARRALAGRRARRSRTSSASSARSASAAGSSSTASSSAARTASVANSATSRSIPIGPAVQVRRSRLPRDVRRAGGDRRPGPVSQFGAGEPHAQPDTAELVRRAENGDAKVIESLAEAGRYLGLGARVGREHVRRRRRRARRLLRPARAVARRRRRQRARRARALVGLVGLRGARVGVRRGRGRAWSSGADADVRAGRAVARRGAGRLTSRERVS